MATQVQSYPLPPKKTAITVAYDVQNFLNHSENMQTQIFETGERGAIVQARVKGGKAKQWIGMDKAITVKLSEQNALLTIEIGESKWVDKGIAMTVSMFVLWPLAITSAVGMAKQAKLPEKIFRCIRMSLGYPA